jgi:TolA-binding protein
MKKYDQAVQELVRVQVNYPQKDWQAKAALEIGRALEAKGDADAAMQQFREVIAKYPNDNVAVVAKKRLDVLRRTR